MLCDVTSAVTEFMVDGRSLHSKGVIRIHDGVGIEAQHTCDAITSLSHTPSPFSLSGVAVNPCTV
jgi:hypothetical protein